MKKEIILENSSVKYIDHMGNDNSIVNAARVSYDKLAENYTTEQNNKLIKYLAKHNHWSPFAHTSITFCVEAPIFVARQLYKHKIGGQENEVSRRYVDYEPAFCKIEELRGRPLNSKQGSDGVIDPKFIEVVYESFEHSLIAYNTLLANGVAPEQARIVLPVGSMTKWYWTGTLVFWKRVCDLRIYPDAQKETREVAELIEVECKKLFPIAWGCLRG